jgi:hypothetical protein
MFDFKSTLPGHNLLCLGRGRPKKTWKDCVNRDLNEVHNRATWKALTRNADPI